MNRPHRLTCVHPWQILLPLSSAENEITFEKEERSSKWSTAWDRGIRQSRVSDCRSGGGGFGSGVEILQIKGTICSPVRRRVARNTWNKASAAVCQWLSEAVGSEESPPWRSSPAEFVGTSSTYESACSQWGQGITAPCLGRARVGEEIVLLIAIEVLKNLYHLDPGNRVVFNNLRLCPGEMSPRTEARNN